MSYSYCQTRQAAKKLDPSTIRKLRRLTDNNDHGKAYFEGATVLGLKYLAQKFDLISKLHRLDGSMDSRLRDYQYDAYKDLMKEAQRVLDPESYQEFHSSF